MRRLLWIAICLLLFGCSERPNDVSLAQYVNRQFGSDLLKLEMYSEDLASASRENAVAHATGKNVFSDERILFAQVGRQEKVGSSYHSALTLKGTHQITKGDKIRSFTVDGAYFRIYRRTGETLLLYKKKGRDSQGRATEILMVFHYEGFLKDGELGKE